MTKTSSLPTNQDNRFWVDGIAAGKLLIQRCGGCGTLRHPPRPMCGHCLSLAWDSIEASGRGHVYSHVVHHRPVLAGFAAPGRVLLVELDEGVRMLGETVPPDLHEVAIGDRVEVLIERDGDGDMLLPRWRPAGAAGH